MYRNFIKRVLDLIGAIVLLMLLCVPALFIMLCCAIAFSGHVFFIQDRIGKGERTFKLYKFITMEPLDPTAPKSDTERLTRFGRFLRSTSLDEIPQLVNILKGDMSLIGPRPLFVHYLPYYTETERLRHSVRPGISGLAQVSGRNELSWDERLALDVQYVRNISFLSDMRIFLKTLIYIMQPGNVQTDPRAVMADLDIERKHAHHTTRI